MRKRDFHRYCRVVYRAMRKQYGTERVQDECLKIFKIVYPVYYKAKTGADTQFSQKDIERVKSVFEQWKANETSLLGILLGKVLSDMEGEMSREKLMQFCDDILVVVMRIRKLTPRECFRLMGVADKDIDIILASGISKSACYKLAGNSIVEDVLFHIFRKLFIYREPDMIKGQPIQLSLF